MPASPTAGADGLPAIEALNALEREDFARALATLFEPAPSLVARLWERRPFRSYHELLARAREVVRAMPEAEQVAVLNAHPRIGESPAAVRAASERSYREQGYDREAAMEPRERARLHRELAELNEAYERRFGFRFVVFLAGRPKSAIVPILRERLRRSRAEELATGLAEFLAIAADRLRQAT